MQAEKERKIRVIGTTLNNKLQAALEALDDIEDTPDSKSAIQALNHDNITITTKEDFYRIVKRGLEDIKAGRVHSLEATLIFTKSL